MIKFLPFWIFLSAFKFGGGLHYTLLPVLGEKILPVWIVGILIGLAAFGQVLLDVPAGYLLDRFGYKRLLRITTAIFACAGFALLLGLNVWTFLLTLAISTFGWLFFGPGIQAYVIKHAPKESIGKFVSLKDVFASVGIVLSSATVIFAVSYEIRTIGFLLLAIFLFAYIAISSSPDDPPFQPTTYGHRKRPYLHKNFLSEAWKAIMRLKPVSFMLISAGLSAAMFYAIVWFVVPILIANSVQNGVLGIGLGIFDFSVVALGFLLGRIVDRFDKKAMVLLGLLIFSVSSILIGFNLGILFILLGFLATTGDELTSLSLWAWLYDIDKKHESYGLISGVMSLFEDVGWTVGPIAAGILYYFVGPAWTIACGGFLILANFIIFLSLVKRPLPTSISAWPRKPHRLRHKE